MSCSDSRGILEGRRHLYSSSCGPTSILMLGPRKSLQKLVRVVGALEHDPHSQRINVHGEDIQVPDDLCCSQLTNNIAILTLLTLWGRFSLATSSRRQQGEVRRGFGFAFDTLKDRVVHTRRSARNIYEHQDVLHKSLHYASLYDIDSEAKSQSHRALHE